MLEVLHAPSTVVTAGRAGSVTARSEGVSLSIRPHFGACWELFSAPDRAC
jgi:hypothetical protein